LEPAVRFRDGWPRNFFVCEALGGPRTLSQKTNQMGANSQLWPDDGQTGGNTVVQTVRPSTVLRPRAYSVSPTLGLRLERLVKVLGVNSRLGSLNSALWYSSTIHRRVSSRYP
jgi:hypothetical protein